MTTHDTAIYENGVLRPTSPLPFREGDRVEFTVEMPTATGPTDDLLGRIRTAKTFDEWIAAADEAARLEPDDGYDLENALNETRRQAGERLLYPTAGKEIAG